MKVVCVHKNRFSEKEITIGKTYELFPLEDGDYYFIDDFGDKPIYFEKYFVTQEQWREQQLNKIGI